MEIEAKTICLSLLLLALADASPAVAEDCGAGGACPVAGGEYRIALPADRPATGVLLFFHGYRGSAESQMKWRSLVETAHRHGLAFAAPDGAGGSWSHPGSPSRERDERAFVGAVLDDLQARFGFEADDVIAGGFSQGASMAWSEACSDGGRLAGMVTFSGVFWEPLPAAGDCVPPPPLVHVHGRTDTVFPLEGRTIAGRFRQGDTFRSLDVVKAAGGCLAGVPEPVAVGEGLSCSRVGGCARGEVTLCLHDGGHEARGEWLDAALDHLGR